jgi:predicted phage-related endonuclease
MEILNKMSNPRGISASRSSAILGLSGYQSQFTVWQKIMEEREPGFNESKGFELPEDPEGAPLRWGLGFESAIINKAESYQGSKIVSREKFFSTMDFITCHIDGAYSDMAKGLVLHEGKTTSVFAYREDWGEPGSDSVPRQYQSQVQHQMLCTGADHAIISVLVFPCRQDNFEELGRIIDPKTGMITTDKITTSADNWATVLDEMGFFQQYMIDRDDELINLMRDKYDEFWKKHVIGQEVPEPQDYADIRRMIKQPRGTLVANEQVIRWAHEYKSVGRQMGKNGNLSKRKEQLKTNILDWMRKQKDFVIDDDSTEKWVLMDDMGKKLSSYDGKVFR